MKGLCPPGRPRSGYNDVALHDCQTAALVGHTGAHRTGCSGERQDLPCTYLAHHEPESIHYDHLQTICRLLVDYGYGTSSQQQATSRKKHRNTSEDDSLWLRPAGSSGLLQCSCACACPAGKSRTASPLCHSSSPADGCLACSG